MAYTFYFLSRVNSKASGVSIRAEETLRTIKCFFSICFPACNRDFSSVVMISLASLVFEEDLGNDIIGNAPLLSMMFVKYLLFISQILIDTTDFFGILKQMRKVMLEQPVVFSVFVFTCFRSLKI